MKTSTRPIANRRRLARLGLLGIALSLLSACSSFASAPDSAQVQVADAELDAYAAMPNGPGSGNFPAIMVVDPALPEHVIYRPADLSRLDGRSLPVVVWGNGGCSADAASSRLHLLEIASHGYLVIAAGRILSGPGAADARETVAQPAADGALPAAAVSAGDLAAGIDWALTENARRESEYFGLIDTQQIAVSGRSCGGLLALRVAADPRVKAVVLHNSGTFPVGTEIMVGGVDGSRNLLDGLHTPVIYIMGGQSDIAWQNALDDFAALESQPVVIASQDVGHGGTFRQPNGGEGARLAVAWLDWQLRNSSRAGELFTGEECGLCTASDWTVMRKSIAGDPR